MRSRACLRPAAATAALAGLTGISLLASGCASRSPVPVPRVVITSPGHVRPAAMASQPTSTPAACSLLSAADVLGVARTFRDITITIDGHEQRSESPQISVCGFNQKGVHASGGETMTDSGDRWAQLTVLAGAASYDFSPAGTMDGAIPVAGVILDSAGNVYGTTQFGGTFNSGVVFKISAAAH